MTPLLSALLPPGLASLQTAERAPRTDNTPSPFAALLDPSPSPSPSPRRDEQAPSAPAALGPLPLPVPVPDEAPAPLEPGPLLGQLPPHEPQAGLLLNQAEHIPSPAPPQPLGVPGTTTPLPHPTQSAQPPVPIPFGNGNGNGNDNGPDRAAAAATRAPPVGLGLGLGLGLGRGFELDRRAWTPVSQPVPTAAPDLDGASPRPPRSPTPLPVLGDPPPPPPGPPLPLDPVAPVPLDAAHALAAPGPPPSSGAAVAVEALAPPPPPAPPAPLPELRGQVEALPDGARVRVEVAPELSVEVALHDHGLHVLLEGSRTEVEALTELGPTLRDALSSEASLLSFTARQRPRQQRRDPRGNHTTPERPAAPARKPVALGHLVNAIA